MSEEHTTNRPFWDKSRDGSVISYDRMKPTDRELAELKLKREAVIADTGVLASGVGRGAMSDDQKFLDSALSRASLHAANLHLFLNPTTEVKEDAAQDLDPALDVYVAPRDEQIRFHRTELARALYQLGEYEQALAVIADARGLPLEGFEQLFAHIRLIEHADLRPDDEMCDCERERIRAPDPKRPHSSEIEGELPRRFKSEMILSRQHGLVVPVYQAACCGLRNARFLPPEQSEAAFTARRQVGARLRRTERLPHLQGGGVFEMPHADTVGQAAETSDVELLKKS